VKVDFATELLPIPVVEEIEDEDDDAPEDQLFVPQELAQTKHQHRLLKWLKALDLIDRRKREALLEQLQGYHIVQREKAFVKAKRQQNQIVREDGSWFPPAVVFWLESSASPQLGPGANVVDRNNIPAKRLKACRASGLEHLSTGSVAIVILALDLDGDLGHDYRGCADLGLLSGKSVIQLLIERIRRLEHIVAKKAHRLAVCFPVFILTTDSRVDQMKALVDRLCEQSPVSRDIPVHGAAEFPVWDEQGNLALAAEDELLTANRGTGAALDCLASSGLLADMRCRAVSSMNFVAADNLLCRVGDPAFLGISTRLRSEFSIKVSERWSSEHPTGILASRKSRQTQHNRFRWRETS